MASYKLLRMTSGTGAYYAWMRTVSTYSGDINLTFSFKCTARSQTNSYNTPSMWIKANSDLTAGYHFEFFPDGIQLQKNSSSVAEVWTVAYPYDTWHTVTVALSGSTITVSKGGVTQLSWTDSSVIDSGYVVFDALGITVEYDEISGTVNDSFESYNIGTSYSANDTFGSWFVTQTGSSTDGKISIESTGLKRRRILSS